MSFEYRRLDGLTYNQIPIHFCNLLWSVISNFFDLSFLCYCFYWIVMISMLVIVIVIITGSYIVTYNEWYITVWYSKSILMNWSFVIHWYSGKSDHTLPPTTESSLNWRHIYNKIWPEAAIFLSCSQKTLFWFFLIYIRFD